MNPQAPAPVRSRGGRVAVATAVAGTVFIAAGAFWLSFTSLADLAARSGIGAGQAWAWPLIVDGVIACSAALVADGLAPAASGYLIGGHNGVEAGIAVALRHLRLDPVVALDLRLGEGSGAALVVPLLQAAIALHAGMATFAEAGVSDKDA